MLLTRKERRVIQKFRRSQYARVISEVARRELEEKRHEFETTLATEGKRGYIQGVKAIMDVLFEEDLEIDNEREDD